MPAPITLFPLGTSSAVPSLTRNQSSLAVVLPSSTTLLFDVGEGTQNQLQRLKRPDFHVRLGKIAKIFITHLHGDHVFGLVPLLTTILNGAGGSEDDPRSRVQQQNGDGVPAVEIYGPKGLRAYVRESLRSCYTHLDGWYVVHELHLPHEEGGGDDPAAGVYEKEVPTGRNVAQDADANAWRGVCEIDVRGDRAEFMVSAAEIKHSVPCVGYVLAEARLPGRIPGDYAGRIRRFREELAATSGYGNPLEFLAALQDPAGREDLSLELPDGTRLCRPPWVSGRKVVVLGDTCDPGGIRALADGCDVLVHEATNAYLPFVDPATKAGESYESVEERARSRGHSTPEMAGRFAVGVGLGRNGGRDALLVLNHFSSKYKDDEADGPGGLAMRIMEGIRECAQRAWDEGAGAASVEEPDAWCVARRVVCARDGVKIEVKA